MFGATRLALADAYDSDYYWNNVASLNHFDGSNLATTTTDQITTNTWTILGTSNLSTTQIKFGTTSLYINGGTTAYGNGAACSSASSTAFTFGTGDFTIECWLFIPTGQVTRLSNAVLWDFRTAGSQDSTAYSDGFGSTGGGTTFTYDIWLGNYTSGTILMSANTWNHIAVCRVNGVTKTFINGTLDINTSKYSATNLSLTNAVPKLGTRYSGAGTFNNIVGYVDDARITKGVARYTFSFVAPTVAFPNGGAPPVTIPPGITATGAATTVTSGGYTYLVWTTTNASAVQVGGGSIAVEYLIVGGGGSGGSLASDAGNGGGGGAGGHLYGSATLAIGTYGVTIGAGGTAVASGNNSTFNSQSAIGGGRGGSYTGTQNGANGGSGGGGSQASGSNPSAAATGTSGQGNNGGYVAVVGATPYGGCGGGGAGAVGGNTSGTNGANGGNGGAGSSTYSSWLSIVGYGVNVGGTYYIAGGGGGSSHDSVPSNIATGGSGGGGNGGYGAINSRTNAVSGTANTGGGGGGGGGKSSGTTGSTPGNGGSGLFILRYAS